MAEAHFDLARLQVVRAGDVVAHLVGAQQVAEVLLVQRGQRVGQLAGAVAAREVVIVVDVFLRQAQRHVGEAARGGAAAVFARAAFQQVAQ